MVFLQNMETNDLKKRAAKAFLGQFQKSDRRCSAETQGPIHNKLA